MPSIATISDTHNLHPFLSVPHADWLIHAGDISGRGKLSEIISFLKWYESLPHRVKIWVARNHDWACQTDPDVVKSLIAEHAPNCIYLNEESVVVDGLTVYGSPWTPTFFNWAFNADRGADIRAHWDKIPTHTNVLITHGPPHGINDRLERGEHVGCEELRRTIDERLDDLKLHVAGHLHTPYGIDRIGPKTFVNAAVVNEQYVLTNAPIVVDIEA